MSGGMLATQAFPLTLRIPPAQALVGWAKEPPFCSHPLKGTSKGAWAVDVSGNWRVVFRFDGKDAVDVDYVDYH